MIKENCYIVTGAPGTGKTALLSELAKTLNTVDEPAREVIRHERLKKGSGLWEKDRFLFLDLLLKKSVDQFLAVRNEVTLFDRGIPDCIAYAEYGNIETEKFISAAKEYQFNRKVFLLTPWEDIYQNDDERTMNYEDTLDFHQKIVHAYDRLGYKLISVPHGSIKERVHFILNEIGFN